MELHKDIAEFKVCQKLQDLEEKEKANVYQFWGQQSVLDIALLSYPAEGIISAYFFLEEARDAEKV